MNKSYILYNLKEAYAQISETIAEFESNSDYGFPEFKVEMEHIYHHLNTAWNAQNSTEQESNECSEENFQLWRRFPGNDWFNL